MKKRWSVTQSISQELKGQMQNIDPIILQLLLARRVLTADMDPTQAEQARQDFFKPNWQTQVHDPYLFKDMRKAVARIFRAIEENEKIVIFGDYDADGICGSTILYETLKRIAKLEPEIYIPHREHEGYGLNEQAVRSLIAAGAQLIITVDLGISNFDEVKLANELGASVIIVDHHDVVEQDGTQPIPPAYAIIHADIPGEKYPFKDLCGTGTAFKLAQGLLAQSLEEIEGFEKWLLDLAAIGTIADVVSLTGENRVLVKYGLLVLNKTQRPGLKALIESARLTPSNPSLNKGGNRRKLDAWNVAWQLVPRLNAAGRISHAREALLLLLEKKEAKARELAEHLSQINTERQKLAEQIMSEATIQIGEVSAQDYLLTAFNPAWPLGVLGLVAGRLADRHHRPVILLTEAQGQVKGSGRSIPELDITQALSEVDGELERFGGHAGACGLSVSLEKKDVFITKFSQALETKLKGKDLRPSLAIDLELDLAQLTDDLVEQLEKLRPFGAGNPAPLFMTQRLKIRQIGTVGLKQQHLKLELVDEPGHAIKAIGFSMVNGWFKELKVNDTIDIAYELSFNEWHGNREIQVKLKDLRKSYE